MNIAIINHSFPPDVGGGESQLYLFSKKLTDLGHKVTVFTGILPKTAVYPYRVITLKNFKKFEKKDVGFKLLIQELKLSFHNKKFDIIFCSNFSSLLIFSYIRDLVKFRKLVFTFHSVVIPELQKVTGYFGDWETDVSFAKKVIVFGKPDAVVCPSKLFKKWALNLGTNRRTTLIVRNCVDINHFKNFSLSKNMIRNWRLRNKIPLGAFVLVLPARLIERKGILDVIKSISKIKNNVFLYLTTSKAHVSEEFFKKINQLTRHKKIKHRIKIVYDKNTVSDMRMIYKCSDALILPSHYEGLPLVILEAMASGLPVLCSNIVALQEIAVDKYNCLMFKSKNPKSIADAVDRLLTMLPDKKTDMINKGYKSVSKNFSLDSESRRLESVFQNLLKKKNVKRE